MPTYEYECDKCKKHFDLFHSMTDTAKQKCPKCGAKAHRLISGGTGIIFKGTGFYENDYKKKRGSDSSPKPSCPSDCKHCPSKKKAPDTLFRKIAVILWSWTPVVLWMGLIYYSSSISADDIPKIDIPNIDKLFHFVEYFILGALLVRAFVNASDKTNFKFILLLSILIASIYGALDEFHQRFVSGRSPEIFDLLSDIIGSFVGALLSTHKEKSSRAIDKTV